jgi:hypothetical protein
MNPSRASRPRANAQDEQIARKEQHDARAKQHASRELVRRIRKLRWMGLTEEAERLQKELEESGTCDCVLATPRDTD